MSRSGLAGATTIDAPLHPDGEAVLHVSVSPQPPMRGARAREADGLTLEVGQQLRLMYRCSMAHPMRHGAPQCGLALPAAHRAKKKTSGAGAHGAHGAQPPHTPTGCAGDAERLLEH